MNIKQLRAALSTATGGGQRPERPRWRTSGLSLAPLALLALTLPAAASGAAFPAGAQVERSAETGKVRFVAMPPGSPAERPQGFSANSSPAAVGRAYLQQHADQLGLDDASALEVVRSTASGKGAASVRYQQTLKGIAVLGGQFAVRLDSAGNITSLNGEAVPGGASLDVTPALDAAAARRAAIAVIAKHEKVRAATLSASTAALRIFDSRIMGGPGRDRPTLVYETTVESSRNAELRRLVLIDAQRGWEVATIDGTHEIKDRSVCDGANNPAGAQVPCTSPVVVEGGTPPISPVDVKPAYDFSGSTYDFFFTRYGRDSLDDAGLPLKSTVRYCDPAEPCPLQNAFWNGSQMVYGFTFSRADDVVGHELAHGLTEFTSGLYYYFQSGALNESLSDVYGEFVDLVTPSTADTAGDRWKVGESLPIGAIRNMQDPTLFGDPDRMGSPNFTLDPGEDDSGGVHQNSGVNNKAAYLITDGGTFNGETITALGLERTARLYYVVETEYLLSASDYADMGNALGQACDSLVGTFTFTSANCDDVRKAVAATEMLTDDGGAPEGPPCPTGQTPSYVVLDDLESATGWTSGAVTGTEDVWTLGTGYATSGTRMLLGTNADVISDSAMTRTAGIVIPAGASLRYRHSYGFEDTDDVPYDGGVVEWSEDNGESWNDLDAGYSGTISPDFDNPLAGRDAYVGESNGYISESVPLTALAGKTVRFRFRIGTDSAEGDFGWAIDDIGVHTCRIARPPQSDGSVRADFNGDGIDDLAVGVPGEDVGAVVDAGAVNVIYGTTGGLTSTGQQFWSQNTTGISDSIETADGFGATLTSGDFNGDGRDDLAIGVPGENLGAIVDAGVVNVIYGSASGLTATGQQLWSQDTVGITDAAETGDRFGSALATGTLDTDAFADLVVGVPDESVGAVAGAGTVHVIPGATATGLTATGSQAWTQDSTSIADAAETGDGFGASLATGALNTAAGQDLAIGAPGESLGAVAAGGLVHVLYGSAGGLTATGSQTWTQDSTSIADTAETGDRFGTALAVGTFDSDAFGDLVVGVPDESVGAVAGAGIVHVIRGATAGLTATGSQLWSQDATGIGDTSETGDGFGASLATGSLNTAAGQDLAVGAPGEDVGSVADAGTVHAIYGSAGGLVSTGQQLWTQNTVGIADVVETGDRFGTALAVGRLDGDAFGDLVVGVPAESVGTVADAGIVHVIRGATAALTATGSQMWSQNSVGISDSVETGDGFGASVGA